MKAHYFRQLGSIRRASLAASAAVAIALSAASGAAASGVVEPMDEFALKSVGEPSLSPDGKTLIYVRSVKDVLRDTSWSTIWQLDLATGKDRPLTTGARNDGNLAWSPDGAAFLFTSRGETGAQLFVYRVRDGEIRQLTNLPRAPLNPRWSPDGKQIAFVSLVPRPAPSVGEAPRPPEGAAWARPAELFDQLRFRWDRKGYLQSGALELFVVPVAGGEARQVVTAGHPMGGTDIDDSPIPLAGPARPAWSPDGQHLYVSTVGPDHQFDEYDSEIFKVSLASGQVRQITDRRGPDAHPVVSPDGSLIAFLGYDDRRLGYQTVRLYVMRPDGSGRREILPSLDRDIQSVTWSKDGKQLYYTYTDQGEIKLARTTLSGSSVDIARDLAQSERAYAVGPRGAYAFLRSTTEVNGQLMYHGGGREAVRPVVEVNKDYFAAKQLGKVEAVSWKSSADGRTITGWLVRPPDFDPKKKYPLVLEIHGGPFISYGPRFGLLWQALAAKGYLVLYTNPRGSTSFGAEFGNLIHHAYPGQDYDDLESGVDAMIARGNVDANNLFVTGASGGGILSAWVIGKTDRYKAAAIRYPAVNFASWVLTTDKAHKLTRYFFPEMPWNASGHYAARSPLSLVGNVTTPALIVAGEQDFRTPISEAEQYYTALKLRRQEAVFARFPDAAHGGSRPSEEVSEVSLIIAWFERHRVRASSPP